MIDEKKSKLLFTKIYDLVKNLNICSRPYSPAIGGNISNVCEHPLTYIIRNKSVQDNKNVISINFMTCHETTVFYGIMGICYAVITLYEEGLITDENRLKDLLKVVINGTKSSTLKFSNSYLTWVPKESLNTFSIESLKVIFYENVSNYQGEYSEIDIDTNTILEKIYDLMI